MLEKNNEFYIHLMLGTGVIHFIIIGKMIYKIPMLRFFLIIISKVYLKMIMNEFYRISCKFLVIIMNSLLI
jgi:hypothetical protein